MLCFTLGVWVVHESGARPLFTDGSPDAGNGLEALAEDGSPAGLEAALDGFAGVSQRGVFNTPTGAGGAAPIFPTETYEFTFTAEDGAYLNFATMLVQSNDLFFAFEDAGLALFQNGNPVGLAFSLTTGAAGTGSFTVILLHEPDKTAPGVMGGDPANAGGEEDINATYPITIQ